MRDLRCDEDSHKVLTLIYHQNYNVFSFWFENTRDGMVWYYEHTNFEEWGNPRYSLIAEPEIL